MLKNCVLLCVLLCFFAASLWGCEVDEAEPFDMNMMQPSNDAFADGDTDVEDMDDLADGSVIVDAYQLDGEVHSDSMPSVHEDAEFLFDSELNDIHAPDADIWDTEIVDAWIDDSSLDASEFQDASVLDVGIQDVEVTDLNIQDVAVPDVMVDLGPQYTQAELDYFLEVVMNIEFGGTGMQRIHKWTGDMALEVHGDPTPIDLAELDLIVAELNDLQSEVRLTVVPDDGNVQLYFSSVEAFGAVEPNYRNGNNGFFWTYWRGGAIVRANIFVLKTQAEVYRRHLLREELTQSMGLMNDSNLYDDSIFYAPWTDVTAFSELDKTIIGMLYREDIEVNMGAEEVLDILDPE